MLSSIDARRGKPHRSKPKQVVLNIRIDQHLAERLNAASSKSTWPPSPSKTQIVRRGIELVLAELETKANAKP